MRYWPFLPFKIAFFVLLAQGQISFFSPGQVEKEQQAQFSKVQIVVDGEKKVQRLDFNAMQKITSAGK